MPLGRDHEVVSRKQLGQYDLAVKEGALQAAENYLRTHDIPIRKTTEAIIGTLGIVNNTQLLHCDCDFEPMRHIQA